jgi:hypothetical protein
MEFLKSQQEKKPDQVNDNKFDDFYEDIPDKLPLNPQDVERSAFDDDHDDYQPQAPSAENDG